MVKRCAHALITAMTVSLSESGAILFLLNLESHRHVIRFPYPLNYFEHRCDSRPISLWEIRGNRRKFVTGPSRRPAKHFPGRVPEMEKKKNCERIIKGGRE